MVVQAKESSARQKIVDAAVDLFVEIGYGKAGLKDITSRAGVTTGAFYHHFDSKEALAVTIINQGWAKAAEGVIVPCLAPPANGLENVILMSFALSDLMKRDKSVWIANHLNQAFGQLTEEYRRAFQQRAQQFIGGVAGVIRRSDIRDDLTLEDVGGLVWISVHGCHLLSDAMMDDVYVRMEQSWRVLLRSIVPAESVNYFGQFLERTYGRYVLAGDDLAPVVDPVR